MKLAYVFLLISIIALGGCERSQVNYEKPTSLGNGYIWDYTGNEMLMWTLAGVVVISLGSRDRDLDDELNW